MAGLDFPLLRSQQEWEEGSLPAGLQQAQEDIRWSEHIVLFFPLWLGDMPALLYRWYFRAHSIESLERNILGFVGIKPVHETLVGMVTNIDEAGAKQWRDKLRRMGERAQ